MFLIRFVLIVVLLAVAAGGAATYLATQRPSVAANLKEIRADPAAARALDDKLEALRAKADAARKAGTSLPVELTISEQELTSKAAELIVPADSPVQPTNVQVHLSDGNVIATSTVSIQGLNVNVGVVATPTVADGKAQLVIQQVQTGGLPLPDAVKQQLNAQIGKNLDPSALGLPMNVSGVQIVDGKIVISGTTK